jgi:hypothetical protein
LPHHGPVPAAPAAFIGAVEDLTVAKALAVFGLPKHTIKEAG